MSMQEKGHNGAEKFKSLVESNMDTSALNRHFDTSHFDVNAIIRGAQLTLVGAYRALQNPAIFTSSHYRQAAIAVAVGIGIRIVLAIPILGIRIFIWVVSNFFDLGSVTWDDSVLKGLNFVGEYVLQVPFFLMALMRYTVPTLDNLYAFPTMISGHNREKQKAQEKWLTIQSFMQSLEWVDVTYMHKHKKENPNTLRDMYYPNLVAYRTTDSSKHSSNQTQGLTIFIWRFARKGLISLSVFAASYLPIVGPFVLPAASFYTFNSAVGLGPASVIFGTGIFLPRRYLVYFLQAYFSSRSLMRELLEPYFARIKFTKEQKRAWFRSREGVLFGFGLGFYILVKVPLVGVLIYGIAEASTAYLITKITDPPAPPKEGTGFAVSQQVWTNKHEFLTVSLSDLDRLQRQQGQQRERPGATLSQ